MEIRYLIYPLLQLKPVFQQVLLKDGRALRLVVVVDIVTLTALLGTVIHDDVATLQRIVAMRYLTTSVLAHDDALQARLSLHAVEYPSHLFADSLFALFTPVLHPLSILSGILALHDAGRVLTLALSDVLPHLGGGLEAGFRWLTASHTIVVSVPLAHPLNVSRLPFPDALDALRALRQSQLTCKPMQCGMVHAAGFHQTAVLLFWKPLAEPFTLLIGQHPRLDVMTACLAQLGREWSVNELQGQHSWKWVYLHSSFS